MKILLPIVLGWALLSADTGSPLDSAWEQAVLSYQSGQPSEAAAQFDHWIRQAEEQGIRSFEAHYNAGLAHGYSNHGKEAALHLVRASRLTISPFKVSTVHRQLAKVQRELGVQESLVNDFNFSLRLFLNSSSMVLWGSLMFWGLILTLTLALKTRDKWAWGFFAVVLATQVGLGSAVGLSLASDQHYGVISGLSATKVTEGDGEKLLELPPGTLVTFTEGGENQLRILSPISGFAEAASIEELPL